VLLATSDYKSSKSESILFMIFLTLSVASCSYIYGIYSGGTIELARLIDAIDWFGMKPDWLRLSRKFWDSESWPMRRARASGSVEAIVSLRLVRSSIERASMKSACELIEISSFSSSR